MNIDPLVLKNFKRFRDEEIQDSRNGITGASSGTTAGQVEQRPGDLLALYGVQATGIAADYIVSGFASPKERCEVRLDFSVGGGKIRGRADIQEGKDRPARCGVLHGPEK